MKTTITTVLSFLLLCTLSCTKEQSNNPQTTRIKTAANRSSQTTGHYIGERFGGGIIFFLDNTGDHGLIADTTDLGLFTWGNRKPTHARDTAIGVGASNTRKIISTLGTSASYAAIACARSTRSGYRDWFLPSKGELNEFYRQKKASGSSNKFFHWSSSEYDGSNAFGQARDGFLDDYGTKWDDYFVRAVRAF